MKSEDFTAIVHSHPEILGGTPVFVGTRVPFQNLIDSLEGGESIEDFLDGFPSVKREQVLAVIEAGKGAVLDAFWSSMRILIDECLNWRLGRALTGHYCSSV